MLRKIFQGGSSKKQGPRIAMHDADEDPPRDTPVRPCEWPSKNFMDHARIKENSQHICAMPVLKILRLTNAPSIMISQVHL